MGAVETEEQQNSLQVILHPSFFKQFEIPSHIYITPHPTIRPYLPYIQRSEIDVEYELKPKPIEFQDSLDPKPIGDRNLLHQIFLATTPGLNSLYPLQRLELEMGYYYYRRQSLPADYAFETQIEKYCPGLLDKTEDEDYFTDTDSEGEGPPQLEVQEAKSLLKKIEGEDKNWIETTKKASKEIPNLEIETRNKINQNFEKEKTKWLNIMPTLTSDTNKFIQNNHMKLFII
eukprot:TRINITY_DN2299_c0_g1_i1.p3 TRINITY_DN2299_c0_g1~~TRINITY_DN2299_c0_g1_i1.p3  ORF type:complete len:231 (+),score=30.89 TRINITY_DN2299_c0_g1_i1:950-1642(+)